MPSGSTWAAVGALVFAGVAGAVYLTKQFRISITPESASPTASVDLNVSNGTPNGQYSLAILHADGTPAASIVGLGLPATFDANGNLTGYTNLGEASPNLAAGDYLFEITDTATSKTAEAAFEVTV